MHVMVIVHVMFMSSKQAVNHMASVSLNRGMRSILAFQLTVSTTNVLRHYSLLWSAVCGQAQHHALLPDLVVITRFIMA